MFIPDNPEPAGEPDTTFEPQTSPDSPADHSPGRRGLNLASHAGVGMAGAAGVLAYQRSGGSDDGAGSAADLDVFHAREADPPGDGPRGVLTEATVVPEPENPDHAVEPDPESRPDNPVQERAEPVHFSRVSYAPVSLAPPPDMNEPPDFAGGMDTENSEHEAEEPQFASEAAVDDAEVERESYLADAGTEIGGGIVPDEDQAASGSMFGASSEIGRLDVDVTPADDVDDDEDALASTP